MVPGARGSKAGVSIGLGTKSVVDAGRVNVVAGAVVV